ncbi:hypothetical protein C2G38_2085757 [Gigaspora rosea]|uniref:Uncharacterized protein n=1 Tax=Gigaspora rosea TaxID=44941 RepID=A0A397V7M5_9GLOM|nr:hypothetical protein C2G38_2085757 [Gigaspora rosea]
MDLREQWYLINGEINSFKYYNIRGLINVSSFSILSELERSIITRQENSTIYYE